MNKISSLGINNYAINRLDRLHKPPSPEKASERLLNNYGSEQTNASGQTETVITKEQFLQALSR